MKKNRGDLSALIIYLHLSTTLTKKFQNRENYLYRYNCLIEELPPSDSIFYYCVKTARIPWPFSSLKKAKVYCFLSLIDRIRCCCRCCFIFLYYFFQSLSSLFIYRWRQRRCYSGSKKSRSWPETVPRSNLHCCLGLLLHSTAQHRNHRSSTPPCSTVPRQLPHPPCCCPRALLLPCLYSGEVRLLLLQKRLWETEP